MRRSTTRTLLAGLLAAVALVASLVPAHAVSPAAATAPAAGPASAASPAASLTGIQWLPWMDTLQKTLQESPGFAGLLPPAAGEAQVLHAFFAGAVPAQLPAVPAGWTLQAEANAHPQPLMQKAPANLIMESTSTLLLPPLAWSNGVSPGAQLYIDFAGTGSPQYICSTNFIWKDQNKNLYVGAAGHCFLPAGTTATTNAGTDGDVGPGATPAWKDSNNFNFWLCVTDCLLGGQSGAFFENFIIQQAYYLGHNPAYARQIQGTLDIGRDFGMIRIPAGAIAGTHPAVPVLGGPSGTLTPVQLTDLSLIHGNAAYDGETFATKTRAGVFFGETPGSGYFTTALKGSGGDSGSSIEGLSLLAGDRPGITVPKAVGILTHGIGVPVVGYGLGLMYGTTVPEAKVLAAQASLCIEVVQYNEAIPVATGGPATC
jgi:hypothetical protein